MILDASRSADHRPSIAWNCIDAGLQPKGPSDGCFFRMVSDQLHLRGGEETAKSLRDKAVKYIRSQMRVILNTTHKKEMDRFCYSVPLMYGLG